MFIPQKNFLIFFFFLNYEIVCLKFRDTFLRYSTGVDVAFSWWVNKGNPLSSVKVKLLMLQAAQVELLGLWYKSSVAI